MHMVKNNFFAAIRQTILSGVREVMFCRITN